MPKPKIMKPIALIEENQLLADMFYQLIIQLQYHLDNPNSKEETKILPFKIKNIKNALKIIKSFPTKIMSGEDLIDIPGIGKGIISRIDEILQTKKLSELEDMKNLEKELKIIDELITVFGIGRIKAKQLINDYDVTSVDDLQNKHSKGLIELSHEVEVGLKYYDLYKQSILRSEMIEIADYLQKKIKEVNKSIILNVCGSYRRNKPISNDIDVLIVHPDIKTKEDKLNNQNYLELFINKLKQDNFILDDLIDPSTETKYMGYCRLGTNPVRHIDIYYIEYDSFYPALMHLTGSGEFNQKIRSIAKNRGYKLSEYGLFKIERKENKIIEVLIPVKSEKEIFDIIGVDYVEPDKR